MVKTKSNPENVVYLIQKMQGKQKQYSTGGNTPSFTTTIAEAKIWTKIGCARQNIGVVTNYHYKSKKWDPNFTSTIENHPYFGAKLVTCKLMMVESKEVIDEEFRRNLILKTLKEEVEGN